MARDEEYAMPISENPACLSCLPHMEKMEGEPGRDAKADQVQKTQCKDTTSHCFMRVLIESNAGDSVFQLLQSRYRWNQPHLRPSKRLTCAHIHVYLSSCSAAAATQLHFGV